MVNHAAQIAGAATVRQLQEKGLLGPACNGAGGPSITCFTTVYRQDIIFREMKAIVQDYLALWYR